MKKCISCGKDKDKVEFPIGSNRCYQCTKKRNNWRYRKKSGGKRSKEWNMMNRSNI